MFFYAVGASCRVFAGPKPSTRLETSSKRKSEGEGDESEEGGGKSCVGFYDISIKWMIDVEGEAKDNQIDIEVLV